MIEREWGSYGGINFETNCQLQSTLPSIFRWAGSDPGLSHSCGSADGYDWVVPYTQDETCQAQWGPYLDGIQPGTYQVGFLVHTPGDVDIVLDVAQQQGAVIEELRTSISDSDGYPCVALHGVPITSCQGTEFRIRYIGDFTDPHSLRILSTSVSPEGSTPNPCF
ncbi:MAG: hypothetical protein HY903_22875 [Deltaproteobacteria bacterium]|nr:hypothetical protein [Deltaproteobacteria bacterium]